MLLLNSKHLLAPFAEERLMIPGKEKKKLFLSGSTGDKRIQILALPKTDKVHRMINSLFERLKEKQYEI